MQGPRYAIILTLLVTALAGERALVSSGSWGGVWERSADRTRADLTCMARAVARRMARGMTRGQNVRQQSSVAWLLIARRLSARRVTLLVSRMVGRVSTGVRLSISEYRLPPPALA